MRSSKSILSKVVGIEFVVDGALWLDEPVRGAPGPRGALGPTGAPGPPGAVVAVVEGSALSLALPERNPDK